MSRPEERGCTAPLCDEHFEQLLSDISILLQERARMCWARSEAQLDPGVCEKGTFSHSISRNIHFPVR